MIVEPIFDYGLYLVPAVKRNRYNSPKNLDHPFRLDWERKTEVFVGDVGEFPIDEFEDTAQLQGWISNNWSGLDDGFWYLMGRGLYSRAKPMRKLSGRQLYKPSHRVGRPRKIRRQHRFEANICLLKFEVESGSCVKIYERQGPRKLAPNRSPLYPVIRIINEKRKPKGYPQSDYEE